MQMLANEPMGGITSGLEDNESVQALSNVTSGIETLFQNIDDADNPKEIMDAIRGDEASVEQRRTELAQLVGEEDANKTPESVLTIVQPLMTVIESTGGISDLDTETPVAPNIDESQQMEAMARMQSGESPVMLKTGNPPTVDINALQKLASTPVGLLGLAESYAPKVTPLATLQEQYTSRPSAYDEYSKILPGLTLARIGQVIGRSPTLLDAALSPETQKQLDPLIQLQLLKAKEKETRLEKAGDVYKEEVKAKGKAKAEMIKPVLTELAKSGFTFSTNEFGDVIAQNARTGEVKVVDQGPGKIIEREGFVGRLTKDPGGGSSIKVMYQAPNIKSFKDDASGKTYLYDANSKDPVTGEFKFQTVGGKTGQQLTAENVVVKEGPGGSIYFINKGTGSAIEKVKGRAETEVVNVDGVGLVVVNKTNNTRHILQGTEGKNMAVYGTEKTGFVAVDLNNTTDKTTLTKAVAPELQQNIDKLLEAQAILRDPATNKNSKQYKDAQQRVQILSRTLFDTSEFENVVNNKANLMRTRLAQAGLEEVEIDRLVNNYKEDAFDDFITKSSTLTTQYNPSESMDKVFAKSIDKLITDTRESATNNERIASFAQIFKEGTKGFRTGTFANARLTIGKLLQASPTLNAKMQEVIGADTLKDFLGGNIAVGETLNKVGAQFAVTFASNFPGNLNQSEVDLIKEAGLQLSTTPKGIEIMEQIFNQASVRSTKELEIINEAMKDPALKAMKPEDRYIAMTAKIDEYRKANPLVRPETISELKNAKPETAQGFYFARKGTDEDAGINIGPNQVARAQLIFKPDIKDADDFIVKYGDEFRGLLKSQLPNKQFSDQDLKDFFNEYRQFDFKQRVVQ